eukprot:934662_1
MGTFCAACIPSSNDTPSTDAATTVALSEAAPNPKSRCSILNCTAIHELSEYCKHYTSTTMTTSDLNDYYKTLYDHYLTEHLKIDPDKFNRKCTVDQCQYQSSDDYEPFFNSQKQRYHVYFYHPTKYTQMKTQRTVRFIESDESYKLTEPTLQTPQTSLTPDITFLTSYTQSHSLNVPKIMTGLNTLKSVTFATSATLATMKSQRRLENLESIKLYIDCRTPTTLQSPSIEGPMEDNDIEFEACPSSLHCPKLKALLQFCRNVDLESTNKKNAVDKDYKKTMRDYWDHCCEAHVYKKYQCTHGTEDSKEQDNDGDDELCIFSRDLTDTSLALVFHRHFYHKHIMGEESELISFGLRTMHGQSVIDKFKPTMDAVLAHRDDINTKQIFEFGFEWTCKKSGAKFKNPKQEMLHNSYAVMEAKHWNQLFKRCTSSQDYAKSARTRSLKLNIKEVISLKLYTDYDAQQNEYRKCYRDKDGPKRLLRQAQFFHWNRLLKMAVDKSNDVIVNTVFHGLNTNVTIPTFSGTYHGPVSTTKEYDIAAGFAGSYGKILELYPSFGKKGLEVGWISNFPDEREVLYFDATFDIKNIFTPMDDAEYDEFGPKELLSSKTVHELHDNTDFIEKAILKALQTINISSTVLSFNEMDKLKDVWGEEFKQNQNQKMDPDDNVDPMSESSSHPATSTPLLSQPPMVPMSIGVTSLDDFDTDHESLPETNGSFEGIVENMKRDQEDTKDQESPSSLIPYSSDIHQVETFDQLAGSELVAVLELLYLQYKPTEWKDLVQSREDVYRQIALAKYRDQFAQLTQNVTTIRMDQASELIKHFFSTSIDIDNDDVNVIKRNVTNEFTHIVSHSGVYENVNYKIRFITLIKLFPKCKTLCIDGDNFDWTLNDFIAFLKGYNLDFSDVQLQDIYILFKPHYFEKDAEMMAQLRLKSAEPQQLAELSKLGWRFINAAHLHRFGFKPEQEKPFLKVFVNEGRVLHQTYSKRILGSGSLNTPQIEGDYAIIRCNEKHLFLTQPLIEKCEYKDTLIRWLEWRKKNPVPSVTLAPDPMANDIEEMKISMFDATCGKVETLVLYPIHEDVFHIFYETFAEKKAILSLETINKMFPNVSDIYLRNTTFNERVCNNLIKFINGNDKYTVKRIFYSVEKQCAARDVAKLKLRLNECKWDFSVIEQVVFDKQETLH